MKSALLLGLFLLPEPHFQQIKPDCGTTHCQITIAEAEAIQAMARDAIGSVEMLVEENRRLKKNQCEAGA